jgi:hypothetical protein
MKKRAPTLQKLQKLIIPRKVRGNRTGSIKKCLTQSQTNACDITLAWPSYEELFKIYTG